jgi:hypothetical protein
MVSTLPAALGILGLLKKSHGRFSAKAIEKAICHLNTVDVTVGGWIDVLLDDIDHQVE